MENEITSKDLAKRFEPLKSLYPQRHYNYIHGKSIENFIYHFDNLPSQAKPRVHQALLNYFEHINSVDITDSSLAQEAFKDYLDSVANSYSKFLSFRIYVKPRLLIFLISVLVIVFYLLSLPLTYYAVLLVLAIAFFSRQYYFRRQRKVFCILY
mgnify:CR=1 FL=1